MSTCISSAAAIRRAPRRSTRDSRRRHGRRRAARPRPRVGRSRRTAVQISARDKPVRADRTVAAAIVEPHQRACGIGAGGRADMHLVPRATRTERVARDAAQRLVAAQHGLDVEQARARRRWPAAPRSRRDRRSRGRASGSRRTARAPRRRGVMREDVDVPAFAADRGEVGDRRLRSGQDDQRGLGRDRWPGGPSTSSTRARA